MTVPDNAIGTCSYCGVENWVFEVVGDVPAGTIGDMPTLKIEGEVGESIPEAKGSNPLERPDDAPNPEVVLVDVEEPVEKSAVEETVDAVIGVTEAVAEAVGAPFTDEQKEAVQKEKQAKIAEYKARIEELEKK